jgi:hypothetical protein
VTSPSVKYGRYRDESRNGAASLLGDSCLQSHWLNLVMTWRFAGPSESGIGNDEQLAEGSLR